MTERTWKHVLEAFLHKLVRSADQIQAVDVVELCGDLAPEQPSGSSGGDCPGLYVLWVAPHEVAEGPLVWNLAHSLYGPHLQAHACA